MIHIKDKTEQQGFMLLLAVLVAGIVLAIGMSILSVALKQFKISSIGFSSEKAFQAANAGMECLRYWDISSSNGGTFDVPGDGTPQSGPVSITCFGSTDTSGAAQSGEEQNFQFEWNNTGDSKDGVCTDVSIYKYYDSNAGTVINVGGYSETCPKGVECTIIQSRGYNRGCSQLNSTKTVERELFVRY